MPQTLKEKILEAETRGSTWLATANDLRERGLIERSERAYEKAQFWLDRYNRLTGNA